MFLSFYGRNNGRLSYYRTKHRLHKTNPIRVNNHHWQTYTPNTITICRILLYYILVYWYYIVVRTQQFTSEQFTAI